MKKILKFICVVFLASFFAVTLTGCTAEQVENGSQNTEVQALVVEVKTESKKQPITFQTTNEEDSNLTSGQTKIKQEGKDGEKEIAFKVTYTEGIETAREIISEKNTIEPINKIILNGTKVTTSNSSPPSYQNNSGDGYVNVDGNYVKSPDDDPAGATARCRDGTYSYSQNRRGTCSYHGGVAEWL